MFQIFLSLASGFISAHILYVDYHNRKKFDRLDKIEINGKSIVEGIITNQDETFNKPLDIFRCPFYTLDSLYNYQTRYYIINRQNVNSMVNFMKKKPILFAERQYSLFSHWKHQNIFTYQSDNCNIDDMKIRVDKNTKINYTERKIHHTSKKEIMVERYIPDKSKITIFGKVEDDTNGKINYVEFIGNKNDVVADIKYKYYGISDGGTIFVVCTLLASIMSFGFCLKN